MAVTRELIREYFNTDSIISLCSNDYLLTSADF
jgi:hypothetical protein